jgi:Skp family chaperone for outer membrane proteins
MKIRMTIPALAVLLLVPALRAQSTGAAVAPPTKVGVINVQVAITSTAEGKQAANEMQAQFAPRQTELDNLRKEIEEVQTRLRTGSNALSDEERARLAAQGDRNTRVFQRKQQESQDDFNEAQREIVDRIGRKMVEILDKYSRENGYAIIFDTSAQSTPVIYAANQIDVTQDIIHIYDQNYPVKNATGAKAAPPKPAAPKPATQPGQTPTKP